MAGINFSGIASGIDGNAIIDATVESKKLIKKPLQSKIDSNKLENESLDKLKEKLLTLQDALGSFATFTGQAVSKNIVVSDENKVTAAASGEAKAGTFSLDVLQLASSGRVTFDSTFASVDTKIAPNLATPKNITINIGQGTNQDTFEVEISSETTLSDLARKISDLKPGKISSSVVNVGDSSNPQFKLMISGAETGEQLGSISVNVDPEITNQGIFSSSQNVIAKNARIRVDGIGIIERSKNLINDVFPGVSLELKQAGNGISLRVNNDSDKTTKRVEDLVTSINSVIEFVTKESRISRVNGERGPTNEFGSLSKTRVDNQLVTSLRSILSQIKSTGNSDLPADGSGRTVFDPVLVPADIGLATGRDGLISFNKTEFQKAMSNSPDKVTNMLQKLADKVTSTGGLINSYTTFDGLLAQTKKSNETENDSLSNRMLRIDDNIEKQRQYLVKLFAKLEEKTGKLNSTSTSLSSIANLKNS